MTTRSGGRRLRTVVCVLGLAVVSTPVLAAAAPPAGGAAAQRAAADAATTADAARVLQHAMRAAPRPPGHFTEQALTGAAVLLDAVGDNSLAPDLQSMTAYTSDDGRYAVTIRLESNLLVTGDFVSTYVNTDGNAATGEPAFGGADVAVGILGTIGTDSVASLRWNGSSWDPLPLSTLVSFPSGSTDEVWSVAASELGIGPGALTTLSFGALYAGTFDDYFDFAPEPGGPPLSFVTGTLVAPLVPPAAVAPAPRVGVSSRPPIKPLGLRSFTAKSSPSTVRLRLSWLNAADTVTWKATLSTRVNGRPVSKQTSGTGAAGSRTVLRGVPVPASWQGRSVSINLRIRDGFHTLSRYRVVRIPGAVAAPAPISAPPTVRVSRHVPAYSSGYNCDDFPLADGTTAQQYLNLYAGDPSGLDGDDDGLACERS